MSANRYGGGMAGWYNPDCAPRTVVRYQGGKNRIAPWIISFFPDHKVYCEPFGGAAGVLMQKKRACTEVYNDISGELVNVFKVLRDKEKAEELKRLLYLTPWSIQEYYEAHEHQDVETDIERAKKAIVRSFMGTGIGSIHRSHCGFSVKINKERFICNQSAAWLTYREAIPAFTERLQGVIIEQRDAIRVIEIYDSPETLFYVDPPYTLETWRGSDKKCYVQALDDSDHKRLLDYLKNVNGHVILSGYDSELYNSSLDGWIRQEKKTINNRNQTRTEIIWISPKTWKALNNRQGTLF